MVFSIGSWKPSTKAAMVLVLGVSTRRMSSVALPRALSRGTASAFSMFAA